MSRVITFSRTFPAYHPKAGQPTFFVEKIINSLFELKIKGYDDLHFDYDLAQDFNNLGSKHHTIRAGKRWKVGDKFSPRVWSGKPYNSKQIIIAPDVEIKKVWNLEIDIEGIFKLNGKYVDVTSSIFDGTTIAENDGLSSDDFLNWFPAGKKPFDGQIICWNENIKYQ